MTIQNLKCETCDAQGKVYRIKSARGWKQHMSSFHGGWNESKAGSDVARTLGGGFKSVEEVAAQAPETDAAQPDKGKAGDTEHKQRTRRLTDDEIKKRERIEKARQKIGGILCRKATRGPYIATAALLNDPRWLLMDEEEKEITEAMGMLIESAGVDLSSKWFAVLALLAAHSDALARRIPLIFQQQQPPETIDVQAEAR